MPRPSQKETIQAAALECFARQGYTATRTRDIAEQAGVSEAAIYRHYASKEELANTLFSQHFGAFGLDLSRLAGEERPVAETLAAILRWSLATYRLKPAAFSFVALYTPAFIPRLPAGTIYPLDVIEQVMARGQRQGVIRPGQPNLLAAIFFGCVLRPIIVSRLAEPGALDLLHDQRHDQVIIDSALAAVLLPAAG
jgi:AcrR family transcriptional regulator